jgi:parallel beta-helix repeat protein
MTAAQTATRVITITVILAVTLLAMLLVPRPAMGSNGCLPTGYDGLTANRINENISGTLEVTCDIGVFFDQAGTLSGATILGTVANQKSVQYGVLAVGAAVNVTNVTVSVESAYSGQFIAVGYRDGASGTVSRSTLSGAHRVGVLIRGAATDVTVRQATITGTGAKTSGWAENGIQVDQGAAAEIVNNTVSGHWWDGPSNWASSGIMVLTDGARVTNNVLTDNEFSIYFVGSDGRVNSNRISSNIVSQSPLAFRAWGVLIAGDRNHLAGNQASATNGAAGVYVFPGATDNRITGNRIGGFEEQIVDGGTGTMARGNPSPVH